MKRRIFAGTALVLLLAIMLSACSGGAVKLQYENGAYRNAEKGLAFRCAPICYRAASAMVDDGAVAILKSDYDADVMLYAIEGLDSKLWMASEDHTLYCGDGVVLPTLAQMKPTLVTNSQAGFGIAVISDAREIADLIETYEKGSTVPSVKIIPVPQERYEMVFSSDTYTGVLYVLECWRFTDDVKVYAKLDANGQIPADLYPGIQAEIVNGEAVFNLGKTLVYDRYTELCYPLGSAYDAYFPMS